MSHIHFFNSCLLAFLISLPAYATPLRERLAHRLPDIERVDLIVKEYKHLTKQAKLRTKTAKKIEEWLLAKSLFLGSPHYDHGLLLKKIPRLNKNKRFLEAYGEFVTKILSKTHCDLKRADVQQKNITILYTGAYGGGHKAPTMALKNYLESQGHTIQLIDVDERENRYSPKIKGYTKADIYAEVYQKQNNPKKARKLTRRIQKAQKTKDKKFLGDIRREVAEFNPDHIFAVAHHKPKLTYISYQLGIPMTYVHTDHQFNRTLTGILYEQKKLQKPLVHFALLNDHDKLFNESSSTKRQLQRLDFPVRQSFVPTSADEMVEIREKLDIPADAYVIKLAMGQNGLADDMKKILNRINEEEKKLKTPLYVYVICGRNKALKDELENYAKSKGKVHIRIMGFLQEEEMAQVDRASNVWVTKPGGSTAAELVATQKQMLYEIHPNHPWEQTNADHLERLGLAKRLSKSRSLVDQIRSCMKRHDALDLDTLPPLQWQSQVDAILTN